MALHAAVTMAFFVDQVMQASVVVQCAQAPPDPRWKWWVQSVIPVAGGTLIAVWSFVQNRKSEHDQWVRNQRAERDQWVRDQRKAEWREILDVMNECQLDILIASTPVDVAPARLSDDLMAANLKLMKTDRVLGDRVFIGQPVLRPLRTKWRNAIKETEKAAKSHDPNVSSVQPYVAFKQLIQAVREAAKKDLGIEDGRDIPEEEDGEF